MRILFESSSPAACSRATDLAASMRNPSPLAWQETLVHFLLWMGPELWGEEVNLGTQLVQKLRSCEYHDVPPEERVLLLRKLCERAADIEAVRDAVDRRAEWVDAQHWSWEAAATLGLVQGRAACQLIRAEPLGRDGRGRLFWFLEHAVWVQSESDTLHYTAAETRALLEALEHRRAPNERKLHFTLTQLVQSGELQLDETAPNDGESSQLNSEPASRGLPLPPAFKSVGRKVPCVFSGHRSRQSALDLFRHVEVRSLA